MGFEPEALLGVLRRLPSVRRYRVAYSGGVDSHALLHALAALRPLLPSIHLDALHVNHGLSPRAAEWVQHCQNVCRRLDIPLEVLTVNARPRQGESPEAAARAARYAALEQQMSPGDGLLTAHQRDDQAETVLLQLLRGCGVRGLAAMPAVARLGQGCLMRPLLPFSRSELADYAGRGGDHWIEDETNADIGLDRNFVRHEVLPLLKRRWLALSRRLARTAQHCAEAQYLLDQRAREDLEQAGHIAEGCLSLSAVTRLEPARQRNVLRTWLSIKGLSIPDRVTLQRVLDEVLMAKRDRMPYVRWKGGEIRRYRDALYAMGPLPPHDPGGLLTWDMQGTLTLLGGAGRLYCVPGEGAGLRVHGLQGASVKVGFRRGGERCRPAHRGSTHALKKLFQERGIPPWLRDRIPLIWVGEGLAAVGNLWICEPFQARPGEPGLSCIWEPDSRVFPEQIGLVDRPATR